MRTKLLFLFIIVSLEFYSQNDSIHIKTFEGYFQRASQHIYSQEDSAYFYFNKALKISNNRKWYGQKSYILSYLLFTSGYHYNLPVMKRSLDSLEFLLKTQKDTLLKHNLYDETNSYLELNKGNYYYKIKDYKRAKPHFLKLHKKLSTLEKTKEKSNNLYSIYSFLTVIYTSEGKYELAKNYRNKAKLLLKEQPNFFNNIDSKNMLLNNYLVKIYKKQKKYHLSVSLLEKTVAFYENKRNNASYKNSLITSNQELIDTYIKLNETNKAIKHLQKTEKYYRKDDSFYRKLYELYGDVYAKQKKFGKSLVEYKKALRLVKIYRNNNKHVDVAQVYQKIASTHLLNKQTKKALLAVENALNNMLFDTEIKNRQTVAKKNFSNEKSIEILHLKSKILDELYAENNKKETLEEALSTNLYALKILDDIKPRLENKTDKQFLTNKVYIVFETALAQCYELHRITNNKKYLEKAFFLLENSKSTQLLEAVNQSKAVNFSNVPEQIIDREQQLQAKIIEVEKNIFTSKNTKEKQKKLINAREDYYSFLDSIKTTNPKYHSLKYNYSVISLNDAKKDTTKNNAFISYFYGKEHVYQLVITSEKTSLYQIKHTQQLKTDLFNFYETVSNFKKEYNFKTAHKLYRTLLPKETRNKTDITIFLDGFLHYIPFEALSINAEKTSYLVEKTSISYNTSFTLLNEQRKKNHLKTKNKLLAIAPEFYKKSTSAESNRADFSPLIFNKEEVKNIANTFSTDVFLGKKATLQNLQNQFKNYSILHFATHASANDEFPDFSYLAFTPVKNKANLWYLKEIYNTKLQADLVTLSACQTGIGKIENGEGSISLARAFSFAGASSLVKSLWKVNDKSSSQIMSNFYKELSKGLPKNIALQKAKKNYLANGAEELQHPFFWAGFVLTGNTKAITSSINYYWLFAVGGLTLLFFIFRKKLLNFFK